MVVVGIIAILVALMFPAYWGMLEKGRSTQCKSNMRALWRGAMNYMEDFNDVLDPNLAAVPPRLPQYWVRPNPLAPLEDANYPVNITQAGWKGAPGLLAITNESITFGGAINVTIMTYHSLFKYVDRDINVYLCPTFKYFMQTHYGITNAYRNYTINFFVAGTMIGRTNSLAEPSACPEHPSAIVLFSEAIMPPTSDYGPATFRTSGTAAQRTYPVPGTNRYHGAQRRTGLQFTNGTFNAIFLDGHIETI